MSNAPIIRIVQCESILAMFEGNRLYSASDFGTAEKAKQIFNHAKNTFGGAQFYEDATRVNLREVVKKTGFVKQKDLSEAVYNVISLPNQSYQVIQGIDLTLFIQAGKASLIFWTDIYDPITKERVI